MGQEASKKKTIYPDATFINHKADISCMAVSDDESMLATGSDDFSIRAWTTEDNSEECAGILNGHNGYVTCLKFHDVYLISGSQDMTVRKWSLATSECLYVFEGHTNRIARLICVAEFIFSASLDATAKAWWFDPEENSQSEDACVQTFTGHQKSVLALLFLPELGSVGVGKTSIFPDDTLFTGSSDGRIISWSLKSGDKRMVFAGHKGPISVIVIGTDRIYMYSGSTDTKIRVWNINNGECKMVLDGHKGSVMCMQLVGGLLYSGDGYGEAQCRFKKSGDLFKTYKGHRDTVVALKFHRGSLYTVCSDTLCRSFNAASGELKYVFKGHTKAVTGLAVAKASMFTISSDFTLRRWKLQKPKREEQLEDECDMHKRLA